MSAEAETQEKLKLVVYAAFLVWGVYLMARVYTWDQFEDWVLPVLFGVPLVVAIVLKLLTLRYPWIVEKVTPEGSGSVDELQEDLQEAGKQTPKRTKPEQLRAGFLTSAWLVVLVASLYLLGYWLTLPVFVFAFAWFLKRDLKMAMIITVFFTVFAYVIFVQILDAFIWRGVLF